MFKFMVKNKKRSTYPIQKESTILPKNRQSRKQDFTYLHHLQKEVDERKILLKKLEYELNQLPAP